MNTRESLNAFRVGLFFLFGTALLYVTWTLLSDKRIQKDSGYALTAIFPSIKTLAPNADVRMAGVKIGSVRTTDLVDGQGQVVLVIEEKYKIPADSVATIGIASLLGQNYVNIEYGNAASGFLSSGGSLPTKASPDFNDIVAKIDDLSTKLNQVADGFAGVTGGDDKNSPGALFSNMNSLLTENREKIDNILTNMDKVTAQLSSGEGTLGKLLTSDEAYNQLTATVSDIQKAAQTANTALADAAEIVAAVKSGEGTLGKLIYDDSAIEEFNKTLKNLAEFSEKLNSGQGTLGKLVNDDTLYVEFRSLLNQAERTLSGMGDSGPITAVGVTANALF